MHLLVSELNIYQTARCNDKNEHIKVYNLFFETHVVYLMLLLLLCVNTSLIESDYSTS